MGRATNRYDVYDKRGKLLEHDITVPEFADAYRLNRKLSATLYQGVGQLIINTVLSESMIRL